MRRSKALPSKTVRKYRSVSQRRMTNDNNDDNTDRNQEEKMEMERLRRVLQKPPPPTAAAPALDQDDDDKNRTKPDYYYANWEDGNELIFLPSKKKRRNQSNNDNTQTDNDNNNKHNKNKTPVVVTAEEVKAAKQLDQKQRRKLQQLEQRHAQKERRRILYQKLQQSALTCTQRSLLLSSATLGQQRPRRGDNQTTITMTTKKQELRRLLQKERAGLTLTDSEQDLLYRGAGSGVNEYSSSSTSSATNANSTTSATTAQKEKKEQEHHDQDSLGDYSVSNTNNTSKAIQKHGAVSLPPSLSASTLAPSNATTATTATHGESTSSTLKKKRKRSNRTQNIDNNPNPEYERQEEEEKEVLLNQHDEPPHTTMGTNHTAANNNSNDHSLPEDMAISSESAKEEEEQQSNNTPSAVSAMTTSSSSSSKFAAQMMASLTALQAKQSKDESNDEQDDNDSTAKEEEEITAAFAHHKSYQPGTPIALTTATTMTNTNTSTTAVPLETKMPLPVSLNRPAHIQAARYALPVGAMEYEIMDSIRNNAVTILCGETGSGKSTQVPQFLYEAGMTLPPLPPDDTKERGEEAPAASAKSTMTANSKASSHSQPVHYLIGITQPRRVAAVSTAKRVCFEMGQGNGQSIRCGDQQVGNLVAYQTRYETAGLGTATHLKFMTDGILLQEIQSDLLLRKYSVIIIDEAHERNLNSDALIGLLSLALPLRQQLADSAISSTSYLPPLKLVIMSATLRVSDFTDNPKLFAPLQSSSSLSAATSEPLTPPPKPPCCWNVLQIPGRNFPVTVHFNKTTVDDYEKGAFSKICKIHRQLPAGGILVFLTGQQEIRRMVRKLEQTLGQTSRSKTFSSQKRMRPINEGGNPGRSPQQQQNVTGNEALPTATPEDGFLRDMDDDEIDGELLVTGDGETNLSDEEEEQQQHHHHREGQPVFENSNTCDDKNNDEGGGIPVHVVIRPLYSMLSTEEQAQVFAPIPDNHRLIVVATNIAETSITIPGISYVVDTGRQKCRNYNPNGNGVASYDIMWISKAAADQRAGRAGRTGPGHCYRLYSSSLYSRQFQDFALPEVLTRPLEDVVLAMKAMHIDNVADFPFPTPPPKEKLEAATTLLANLGCIDVHGLNENPPPPSNKNKRDDSRRSRNDGKITRLGGAVAKLPLGVRYGKMLLVAAEAGVLDYAIVMVALLSESNPFVPHGQLLHGQPVNNEDALEELEESDADERHGGNGKDTETTTTKKRGHSWSHRSGDVLAGVLAVGAYTYAGRGAGGIAEKVACRKFCEEHGLNSVIMARILKLRTHLARLAKRRLPCAPNSMAAQTGGFLFSMKPPNKTQEQLLCQAIASGLLDHVAMLAPLGSIPANSNGGNHSFSLRSAYLSCTSSKLSEPLWMDRNSVVYSRDPRRLPQWICYDSVVRKTLKDGTSIATIKRITPIEPDWLGPLAQGSRLLKLGDPVTSPVPRYDAEQDLMVCSVETKFGDCNWEIAPISVEMYPQLQKVNSNKIPGSHSSASMPSSRHGFLSDDSFRWFARYLLEGKVLPDFKDFHFNDSPSTLTRHVPSAKVALLVTALARAGVDSAAALRQHWAETDSHFLYKELVPNWIIPNPLSDMTTTTTSTTNNPRKGTSGTRNTTTSQPSLSVKARWMKMVQRNIQFWRKDHPSDDER